MISASAVEPVSQSLQKILLRAQQGLTAATLPNVEQAHAELDGALRTLERYVDIDSSNGQAWGRFLRLDELRQEMASETPQVGVLVDLEMNMRQNYLGLEQPAFVQLREKLNRYVRALRYGANPQNTISLLDKKISDLVAELDKPQTDTGLERSSQVGVVANYLYESGQVPWAVTELRNQFNTPNLRIYAAESLVNRLLMRAVAEPSPVDECILGTRILGRACLTGSVSADVVPMTGGVSLCLNLSANMTSRNKGYNRGVVLNTTGSSPVFVSKQVFLTPAGLSSTAATASTDLQSTIESIEHRLGIVRRIAQKKAAQQKPQADAIAERRLKTKIQTRVDEQVGTQLVEADAQLNRLRVQPPEMRRIGFPRPSLGLDSTYDSVQANAVQATAYQLAATHDCGIPRPFQSEVVVEGHQSAAINALDIVLGGRTIHSENLDDFAYQILGRVPPEIQEEAAGEAWSITFASFHPVELEFDDGQAKIILRITKMTRGDQSLQEPAIISATYTPTLQDGGLRLQRDTDVEVEFVRSTRGVRAVTLRSFLKGKFENTFKEEIVTKPLDLTQKFPRAPNLMLNALTLDDGWVQVGLR